MIRMKDLAPTAVQEIPVPLPPAGGQGRGRLKSGSFQPANQQAEIGRRPGPATAETGRHGRDVGQKYEGSPPHAQPGVVASPPPDHNQPRPHLEPGSSAAGPAHGHQAPSHPGPGQAAHVACHDHQSPAEAMIAAREAASHVVARMTSHPHQASGHFRRQPVAGISLDLDAASCHPLGGVSPDGAGDEDRAGGHPRPHGMDAGKVAPALNHSTGRRP